MTFHIALHVSNLMGRKSWVVHEVFHHHNILRHLKLSSRGGRPPIKRRPPTPNYSRLTAVFRSTLTAALPCRNQQPSSSHSGWTVNGVRSIQPRARRQRATDPCGGTISDKRSSLLVAAGIEPSRQSSDGPLQNHHHRAVPPRPTRHPVSGSVHSSLYVSGINGRN